MNKAITDGFVFMPPAFDEGLAQWSKGNGTPGTASWNGDADSALVPSDPDFGSCVELQKTSSTVSLRYMGQTPLVPGCYLRVQARFKMMSGNMPTVRIGGWPGDAGNTYVSGLNEQGSAVTPTAYGDVYTVSAIVGSGSRTGVNMPWGTSASYGHFGIDLSGASGGILRVESIEVEDVTSVFLRDMMDWVDVRDYGAVGDNVTDDSAAFESADVAANGRRILVPAGSYRLNETVTLESAVRFEGTVSMPDDKRLQLMRNFDLDTYFDAFGDEVLAFKKAFQAFLNYSDHEALDLCGRVINVTEPFDMQAAVGNVSSFTIRRVIRNGQFNVFASTAWDPTIVTSSGTYDPSSNLSLTGVTNIAQIPVGSLVTGNGVGREVYVHQVNIAANSLTLSQPLHDAAGTQTYTFTRFKYVLDFSGFGSLQKFELQNIDFRCNSNASAIMLAPAGDVFHISDCEFTRPKDRAITSIGRGCQSMMIDRCNLVSWEINTNVQDRSSVGINVNANDVKIRDCRAVRFKHFIVLHGSGHVFTGNHWFQGDDQTNGPRTAGIVFTQPNIKTTMTGNYLDNSFIEWTNEHDHAPDFNNEFSFGGLTITGNIFTVNNSGSWFRFIVVKPYGADHFVQGLIVSHNVFKALNVRIDRVDAVDDSIAPLAPGWFRNVTFMANTFNSVDQRTISPVTIEFSRSSVEQHWVLDFGPFLPFVGDARTVTHFAIEGPMQNTSNQTVYAAPYFEVNYGPNKDQVRMSWPEPVKGTVHVTARADKPY